ncbi:little elongation complex subunit 2 [Drosophila bipectinata]|uniref:little elongation complex subunit 2 n=1 Tax=Drosophila bipectinata TaxID=42026 RepID=UPI001C89A6C8|nr:little elongation complex subunit 2 [Drosophila bipectinata]
MDTDLYQGHSIFRDQPSFKFYNKSFEDKNDSFFVFLNEVDPVVLREELEGPSRIFTSFATNLALKDPRTKEIPQKVVYDHTSTKLGYEFYNPQQRYSDLTPDQQAACVRALLSLQRGEPTTDDDFEKWNATEGKRCTERQQVQKHFHDYELSKREVIYVPMKRLVTAYRKWYDKKVDAILKNYPDKSYTTFSGLPQLSQCKSLNGETASIEEIELERVKGRVRLWPEVKIKEEVFRTLNVRLDRYSGTKTEDFRNLLKEDEKKTELQARNIFVLPLETLLMLLTGSSYVDLPTEMFFDIKESSYSGHKCVEFQNPFPARNCGWHTNNLVLNQAFEAYSSQPGEAKWLDYKSKGIRNDVPYPLISETSSLNLNMSYDPPLIDEDSSGIPDRHSNAALVSWILKCQDQNFQMFSTLSIPAVRDGDGKKFLGCHFIKLENKPDCGCEFMTKYELLKAWLQIKLLQAEVGHCTRVSLQDFSPVLEENLTLEYVEQQLSDYYNTSMPQLLSNLFEFLKIFHTVPVGEYMLRYSPKYKDRLLLCTSTKEATPQSFQLHQVLREIVPSDQNFLAQSSYLPISARLCGRMHKELQLVPCSFPSKPKGKFVKRKDLPIVLKKDPPRIIPKKSPKKRHQNKTKQKARAKARKKEAMEAIIMDNKELDKIMVL